MSLKVFGGSDTPNDPTSCQSTRVLSHAPAADERGVQRLQPAYRVVLVDRTVPAASFAAKVRRQQRKFGQRRSASTKYCCLCNERLRKQLVSRVKMFMSRPVFAPLSLLACSSILIRVTIHFNNHSENTRDVIAEKSILDWNVRKLH